jgi:hypothetical protein
MGHQDALMAQKALPVRYQHMPLMVKFPLKCLHVMAAGQKN